MTYVPALLAPALAALVAYALTLPQSFGAHPWWSAAVIWIGLPIGLVIAALLARLPLPRLANVAITAAGAIAAFAIASSGKARFAASYAEDTFGGQMWYFGWIATCALIAALLAATLWPRRAAH